MSGEHCLFNRCGNILISDQFNNRVIETTDRGTIVWSYGKGPTNFTSSSIIGVNDAQRVGSKTLMAGTGIPAGVDENAPNGVVDNRVILVNKRGDILWQYGQFGLTGNTYNLLNTPVQCTYVPPRKHCYDKHDKHDKHHHDKHHDNKCHKALNGGTVLITDQGNQRVIEVNEDKKIVWQYPGTNTYPADQLNNPNSAEKLENGHVLIADELNNRAIEVNHKDQIVKVFTASGTLGNCAFASRLPNGNTLLTDAGNGTESTVTRAVEVDPNDIVVWQFITNSNTESIPVPSPSRALRLANGDTIISDQFNNRVIIVNRTNVIIAKYGLPLEFGANTGYDLHTTQLGLYAPYDAKIIGDYTGITNPCNRD